MLVPGLGLFGLGRSKQDAVIAADIAEAWIEGVGDAEAIGRFESISEADMFDCEYWPLEQAKLGARKELPLAGQIAAITGAAGAIGAATAKAFAAAGAEVALLDVNLAARARAGRSRSAAGACRCNATSPMRLRCARHSTRWPPHFGGVDIVVSNAGAAWQGRIGEVDEDDLAQELRAQFLRPSARGAGRGEDHAARKAPAAACSSTSPSRRSIPARISAPTACRRRRCWR